MSQREAVELQLGGRRFRVVSSTEPSTLHRLAARVNAKVQELGPHHPDALALVALALAHDLERAEEAIGLAQQGKRELLGTLVQRVDAALDGLDENGQPLAPLPAGVTAQR